jgi:UDP-N-acetylmuramyl pentapeptide synthase
VAAAIESLRPANGTRPRDRRPAQGLAAALAKKLGVAPADVRAALQSLRSKREQQMSAERDAFATRLAGKLGISADKVKSVLSDHGPFGLHPGPGGPGAHGRFRHP